MNKSVRIIRHVDCEGPGYLLSVLERHKLPYEIIAVDQGSEIPQTLDGVLALVSMGGGMSANDSLPWIKDEIELIRLAEKQGVSVLGHCLGAQLMAKALGASVHANRVKEIGWFDIYPATSPVHPLFTGLNFPAQVFHWHGETFSLPPGAENLLSSKHCQHQCFIKGNLIGWQCHIEMTADMINEWLVNFAEQIQSDNPTEQAPAEIVQNLKQRIVALNQFADRFYERWIKMITTGAGM